jgi:hypothetical protein
MSSASVPFLTLVPAIVLAVVGLSLIGFILWALLHSAWADVLSWAYRQKLAKKERSLAAADALIKNGAYAEALPVLRDCFLLDQLPRNPALIEGITHHHLSVLSRLIAIGEGTSSHVPNLAIVEDLFSSRAQYLRTVHETYHAKKSLGQRKKSGKELPEWAVAEYDNKLEELTDKLDTNRKSLENKIAEIFTALSSAPTSHQVTYH